MKSVAAFVLISVLSIMVSAQTPVSIQKEAMKKLDFLVGQWTGEGWVKQRDGERRTFSSAETIQSKLDGLVLLIEGTHTGFEALALVSYDKTAKQYRWRSFTSDGRGGDVEAKLIGERTLQWGREGRFRYTIKISEGGLWNEVGESSQDGGETWVQFFEMKRQSAE